jgi:hypothetical protein
MKSFRTERACQHIKTWRKDVRRVFSYGHLPTADASTVAESVAADNARHAGPSPSIGTANVAPPPGPSGGQVGESSVDDISKPSPLSPAAVKSTPPRLPEVVATSDPPPQFKFCLIISAEILVSVRIHETYSTYIDPYVIPKGLEGWSFNSAKWALHLTLSWDEIGKLVKQDQVRTFVLLSEMQSMMIQFRGSSTLTTF